MYKGTEAGYNPPVVDTPGKSRGAYKVITHCTDDEITHKHFSLMQ